MPVAVGMMHQIRANRDRDKAGRVSLITIAWAVLCVEMAPVEAYSRFAGISPANRAIAITSAYLSGVRRGNA